MNRRLFLTGALALPTFVRSAAWRTIQGADGEGSPDTADAFLAAAERAARWIASTERATDRGPAWPADASDHESVQSTLYHGVCGPTLFALALRRAGVEGQHEAMLRTGADYLSRTIEDTPSRELGAGLYTGLGGIAFTLFEAAQETGEERYRRAALAATRSIVELARPTGAGVEWGSATDVISGDAGTVLFCLDALERMDAEDALAARLEELALASGARLCEIGIERGAGLEWFMTPDYPRTMPNFSHGTAGVAYALAVIHARSGEARFLDAARRGALHLRNIADERCLVYHHAPEGEQLFYLGWCHGPPGTGRLFHLVGELTGEEEWGEWLAESARSLRATGIPEERPDGFWNNVGVCCGSAGVAEFALDLHGITGEAAHLDFSRKLLSDVLERGVATRDGLHWPQAEHRARPDLLQSQTGYMQGAAGIGIVLLRHALREQGRRLGLRLPDSPFAS